MKFTQCSLVEALEAATLHPAEVIGKSGIKGTLDFGADADFVIIDQQEMNLMSTWIAGSCVYRSNLDQILDQLHIAFDN